MKKRVYIISLISSILGLFIIYLISNIFVINTSKKNQINYFYNTSYLASNIFDGTNFLDTVNKVSILDNNIILYFYDANKTLVYDSINKENVNKVIDDITPTNNQVLSNGNEFYYISNLNNKYYIKLVTKKTYINTFVKIYIFVSVAIFIVFSIFIYILFTKLKNKIIKLINNDLILFNEYDKEKKFAIENIAQLSNVLNNINETIHVKIKELTDVNDLSYSILNSLNEAIILIENKHIKYLNKEALKIFYLAYNSVINKHYIYLTRNKQLLDFIKDSYKNKKDANMTFNIAYKYYYITSKNIIINKENMLLLYISDITKQENVNIIKKDFFSNCSHELKSPITNIIGYTQLIKKDMFNTKEKKEEAFDVILKEANKMNMLINDMLELSNIEYNKRVDIKDVNIKEVLENVIKKSELKINKKNLKLQIDIQNVILKTSSELMDVLFSNLIDNAIKYNKDNGLLKIELNNKYFSVMDTGIGIQEDQIQRVFERFYRINSNINGTGLGLSIVKHICEKLNYKITLESVYNVKTIFKIEF